MKREIWEILTKKNSGEILQPDEAKILEEWLSVEENQQLYQKVESDFRNLDLYFKLKSFDTSKAWQTLNQKVGRKKVLPIRKYWPLLAAAAVIIFALAIQNLIPIFKSAPTGYIEVFTQNDDHSRPVYQLPDGSKITLNYGTKLVYPNSFSDSVRLVQLSGQAFFEVAPNREKPFIIKTNGITVKVLGTTFCVTSFEAAETTEVMVQTGSVELASIDALNRLGSKTIVLFPGEKGLYKEKTKALSKTNSYNVNRLAWFTRTLKFESETLGEVLETLSETFNIQFEIDQSIETSQTLSATFEHQELDYILKIVALTLGIRIEEQEDGNYFVHK